MLTLSAWLTLTYVGGWLSAWSFTGRATSMATHAAAVPTGLVLSVLFFRITGGACSPWVVAGLVCAFAACVLLAGRYVVRYDAPVTRFTAVRLTGADWLAIFALFIFFVIHSLTFLGNDEINHFFFASQIVHGKFPPSAYGFPDVPAKYHYGWDILLASGILVSGLPHPVVSDVLTAYTLLGVLPLAFCILQYLGAPTVLRVVCGVGLFVGDGLAGGLTFLLQGHYRRYLTLTNLYHQHPWTLALGLFFLSLVLLAHCTAARRMKSFLFPLGWLTILYLAVPICSGVMIPIAGMVLMMVAVRGRFPMAGIRWMLVRSTFVALVGVLLLASWPWVGGIAVAGDAYDRPAVNFALSVFGPSDYLKYEAAYVFMAPVAFAVFGYAIVQIAARRRWIGFGDAVQAMLWLCVLLLVPCPMILIVENSAYWDNFCKFNFIGVLAAWLLLPTVVEHLGRSLPAGPARTGVRVAATTLFCGTFLTVVLLAAGLSIEAFADGPCQLACASSGRFVEAAAAKRHLIDSIERSVDLKSNILIADSRIDAVFPISRTTNRAGFDQYGHFTEYFGEFKIVPQVTGRSILNFYDYNFFYARDREYEMADAMDRAFSGDCDALHRLKVSHVLCARETAPDYLRDWERQGKISLTAASTCEGWRLYRVR
jgi:hypothetical protein